MNNENPFLLETDDKWNINQYSKDRERKNLFVPFRDLTRTLKKRLKAVEAKGNDNQRKSASKYIENSNATFTPSSDVIIGFLAPLYSQRNNKKISCNLYSLHLLCVLGNYSSVDGS